MKKLGLFILAMMIALTSATAYAATGDALLGHREDGSGEWYQYGFDIGDTLYLVTYDGLATYHIGDADVVRYTWDRESALGDEDMSLDVRMLPFAAGNELRAVALYTRYDEHAEFVRATLNAVTLEEDGMAHISELVEVDWSDMVDYYDEDAYPRTPDGMLGTQDKLYMRVYDDNYDPQLVAVDLETGRTQPVDAVRDPYVISAYRDGKLLIEQYSYTRPSEASMLVYDGQSDAVETLGTFDVSEYSPLMGIAYDREADAFYCLKGGEVCPFDPATGEIDKGVADIPLEGYGNGNASLVMQGGYYVYCADGAAIRNLDPAQRAETRLKVFDSTYSNGLNTAFYQFTNAHGDVSVAISRDYADLQAIVENMMNRDSSVDIYILQADHAAYNAVYSRGYMLELEGSEKIAALADRVYPGIQEAMTQNGHIVALPMDASSWTLAVNEKALEAIGLTLADVPTNWMDFLDFLGELPRYMTPESRVTLLWQGMTAEDARNDFFYTIFNDYQKYVNAVAPDMGYDTPVLHQLLQKLEAVDFTALGLPHAEPVDEDEDAPSGGMRVIDYGSSGENEILQLLETSTGCTFGNFYEENTPILMSLDAQTPAYLVLNLSMAFVNPFTQNRDAVMQFMETLADNIPASTLYCIDPSQDQPVRSSYYESSLAEMQEMLEERRAAYESAPEVDKQAIEEELRSMEENLEWIDRYYWEISPASIEWYRSHDDNIAVETVNWLYSDDSGDAYELISQYIQGQIGIDQMLSGIDRKVQMRMMEGN